MRKFVIATVVLAALPLPGTGAIAADDKPAADPTLHLVTMDEIRVPIIDADRLEGTLRMKLVLQGSSAEGARRMQEGLPDLRSAALEAALEFARLEAAAARPVDAEALDRGLTTALRKVAPGLGRVLIVEVAATRG